MANMRKEAVLWSHKQILSDWCTILNGPETKSVWEKWMESLTQACTLKYATNELTSFKVMFRVQHQIHSW